jgi:hypothetical protein
MRDELASVEAAGAATLYLAYRHPRTPWYVKLFAALIVGYVFSWKVRLRGVNTICTDSLSLFSESPAILDLFGARRLSQQDYPSFPEP